MDIWNERFIAPPPNITVLFEKDELSKLCDLTTQKLSMRNSLLKIGSPEIWVTNLNNLLKTAKQQLFKVSTSLELELKCLHSYIYQGGGVHKKEKYVSAIKKVARCLKRWKETKIGKLITINYDMIPKDFISIHRIRLPSPKSMYYLLHRLVGAFHLLLRSISYCLESSYYFKAKLVRGFSISTSTLGFAIIGRIREKEKNLNIIELQKFDKLNERCKELEIKKQQEKDALKKIAEERISLIKELQEECERQSEERRTLEKCFIKSDLGISLHKNYCRKTEIEELRLEEGILIKEAEERKKIANEKEKAKREEENIRDERESQIRQREKLKSEEKERERKYIQLLTEVMAEEEGLHLLRSEVANRKRREHFIAAQMILDERRKRRKESKDEEELLVKEEKEFAELRNSILEEEERRLLLSYLPHIGPFLSPYVIQKLSLL